MEAAKNKVLKEGRFEFTFHTEQAVKFDESDFYTKEFHKCPGGKGVDFLAIMPDYILMVEVKNCSKSVEDNVWRIRPQNLFKNQFLESLKALMNKDPVKAKKYGKKIENTQKKDSFDIDVSKKVAYSLACLYGGWTKSEPVMTPYWKECLHARTQGSPPRLRVILFLEGSFGSDKREEPLIAETESQIFLNLQNNIQTELDWLNCEVTVVNSDTYRGYDIGFSVTTTGG